MNELVCYSCVKGRRILSSTVVPEEERNYSLGASESNGGRMKTAGAALASPASRPSRPSDSKDGSR